VYHVVVVEARRDAKGVVGKGQGADGVEDGLVAEREGVDGMEEGMLFLPGGDAFAVGVGGAGVEEDEPVEVLDGLGGDGRQAEVGKQLEPTFQPAGVEPEMLLLLRGGGCRTSGER